MVRSATPAAAGPGSAGVVPYCQMTASKSSPVSGNATSAGPTAVAQRRVTPSASREVPMVKRGTTRWPPKASVNGSAPRATGPDPRVSTASSHGMAASAAAASRAGTSSAVPHPTSVSPGRSKSTVGLPSNSSASGPYSSGTVRACSAAVAAPLAPCRRRRGRCRRHGAPVRVATTIWLRPPARGRIPTAENPAARSMARRTGVGGR